MWLPGLLLSLLVLAASQAEAQFTNLSPCLLSQASRDPTKFRPVVKRRSTKYKTILSLDGGDVRATIMTAVLCEVENAIKRALITKNQANGYHNPDDFDILLSDYFDVISGSSAGTYLATYLGTDGADAATALPLHTARPGSALGAYQFMESFATVMQNAPNLYPPGSNYTVVGSALYAQFDSFLSSIYGNRTLMGPFPTLGKKMPTILHTWSRISSPVPQVTLETGMGAITTFTDPQARTGGILLNDVNGVDVQKNQSFYLWQSIRGSTSWPPRVPAYIATTTPDSPEQATYAIADGAISGMDPTCIALPYLLKRGGGELKHTAILSLGTAAVMNTTVGGTTFPVTSVDWISGATNPVEAWGATLGNRYRTVNFVAQLFKKMYPGQYLRIDQEFEATPAGNDCGVLFTGDNCTTVITAVKASVYNYLPIYTYIGATWAAYYSQQIDAFVSEYITR